MKKTVLALMILSMVFLFEGCASTTPEQEKGKTIYLFRPGKEIKIFIPDSPDSPDVKIL